MAKNLFSVPIFFIAFRECLEAALIIAILLGLVEQIVYQQSESATSTAVVTTRDVDEKDSASGSASGNQGLSTAPVLNKDGEDAEEEPVNYKVLVKRMRIQVSPQLHTLYHR